MLKQQDYILTTDEEIIQIEAVKELIHDIHESGIFFQLSLRTLELIRRFNNLCTEVFINGDDSPSLFNQLVIISKNLETSLVREN
ncbi:hypothetical protein [Christiangramia salexigens]|uniref:Uncharacterized protein n=1 Tax=Christiangramia salexigens TaxID=1913577 RepID=A0A1L3J2Z3_9FLAO|nr:hypothetical protein [Christiangramia salexigens]APG59490.1 hypothetical protein LPB144_03280 [Christiangramia salexigens]